jgi:CheY-like chemotaxis protein
MDTPQINSAPVMDDMAAETPQAASSTSLSTANLTEETARPKILIVEDEPDARVMFVDLLESEDKYDVSSANDGIEALAKAAADRYDLILLDIVMPNKDGIEVLEEIKSQPQTYGKPIIVMLTNISGDAAVEKAIELGAAGYKLKIGTEPEELLTDVANYLNGTPMPEKQVPPQPVSLSNIS